MKQILQEMRTFEEPKVALVKKQNYSLLKKIGGYIIITTYNEESVLEDTKTLYFDEHGVVDKEIVKIITYIPRGITLEQLSDIDFGNKLCYIYNNNRHEFINYNFSDIVRVLMAKFGFEFEMPKKFFNKEHIIDFEVIISKPRDNNGGKYSPNLKINLYKLTYSETRFERDLCRDSIYVYYNYKKKDSLEHDLPKFISDHVVTSIINQKYRFDFKYRPVMKKITVSLRKNESENEMIREQTLKFINERLEKERERD